MPVKIFEGSGISTWDLVFSYWDSATILYYSTNCIKVHYSANNQRLSKGSHLSEMKVVKKK